MDHFTAFLIGEKQEAFQPEKISSYPFIGKGAQGSVYKISSQRCVKIYKRKDDALNERKVLEAAGQSSIVPKLFEFGPKYNVMEYIEGISLEEYLKSKPTISEKLTNQILGLFKEMKRLKFARLDARLRHLIITTDGKLKVIDHVNSFRSQRVYPKHLLKGLKELGLLSSFLKQAKKIDPKFYREWIGAKS